MAEISKQALKVDNNQSFPNNNNGAITPAILRAFNVNMIDSMVDELGYNVDSSSWNQQIDALEQFTASASGLTTGSLLITASAAGNVITFTKGNNSTFNVTVATGSTVDISNLNQATASLQQFTQSAQISINNLNTTTASLLVETQNLELFSASALVSINNLNQSSASQQISIDSLNSKTGSYATTGSNTFVGANIFTSISASSFISASEFIGNGSKITGITASISMPILDEGIPQGNAVSLNFTGSGISAFIAGGTAIISVNTPDSGTINNLTASFNTYTASTDAKFLAVQASTSSLNTFTASFSTSSLVSTSSFNAYTSSTNNRLNNLETTTASLLVETQNLELFSASALVSISNLNTATASVNISISNINTATASLFTSASLAIVTASFDNGTRNLTFTKGNTQTFSVNIPDVSGSTGNFATTGSNTFVGNQTITGSINISGSINMVNGADLVTHHVRAQGSNGLELQTSAGTIIVAMGQGGGTQATFVGAVTANSISASTINGLGDPLVFSTSVDSRLDSLEGASGSYVTTSSFNSYTSSNDQKVNSLIAATGSYATTGSNVFTGDQTLIDNAGNFFTISDASGSMMLVAKGFTSASAHISASSAGIGNFIFKTNSNTADTTISGSGNIFTNPGAPTAGFKRYLTSGNISMMGALPQISASMQFSPTISNNTFFNVLATANPITIRGPISSSAYTINNNQIFNAINLGTSAANNAEKIVAGVSINSNIIQTLAIVANRTNTTQVATINNNQLNGVTNLNMNSSSIDLSGNLWYGTNTITNNSSGSSRVSQLGNAVGLYQNILLGTNTITFSGSNDPNDTSDADYQGGVYRSMIMGTNTPFVQTGPTGSNSISNTAIIGNGLIVTGSSGNPAFGGDSLRHGSLFAGRFNAVDGNKDLTAETIFAVGTGTSTSARKTGLLIDSGSNTFIEGTLNVSGSTTMTGSLILSSSNAVELTVIGNSVFTGSAFGNVIALSITSNTASMDLNLGNYFTLTLADTATTHISASNVQPGTSATLVITTGTDSSASLAPTMLQPSGSAYSATNGSAKKDVLSIVAVTSGVPFVVSTKNMV